MSKNLTIPNPNTIILCLAYSHGSNGRLGKQTFRLPKFPIPLISLAISAFISQISIPTANNIPVKLRILQIRSLKRVNLPLQRRQRMLEKKTKKL